jgi:hypothetical protein
MAGRKIIKKNEGKNIPSTVICNIISPFLQNDQKATDTNYLPGWHRSFGIFSGWK